MLHRYEGPSNLRSRSGRNSYADLQQLRHSITGVHRSAPESEAMRLVGKQMQCGDEDRHSSPHSADSVDIRYNETSQRQSQRERRSSLSENISVERISQVDPQSTFEEATNDINNEVMLKHPEKLVIS
jgi:hypothetical protein